MFPSSGSGSGPVWTGPDREVYSQFLREMIIQPGLAKANMGLSREDVTLEDHVSPLYFKYWFSWSGPTRFWLHFG